MYIRCLDCQSSSWIESVEPGSTVRGVSCRTCGREYTLEVPSDLGATQRDQYQKALGFAESHGIDLPSAYSTLLGIMSVDEARGLREKAVSTTTKAAAAKLAARKSRPAAKPSPLDELRRASQQPDQPPSASGRKPPRGPAGPGIDAGTPPDPPRTTERGRRRLLAARLARNHGLSRRLAYEVAGDKITLQAALRRQAERKGSLAGVRVIRLSSRQRGWITGIASVAFMLLAVNGVCLWHGYAEEAEAAQGLTDAVARQAATTPPPSSLEQAGPSRTVEATRVQTDDAGRILSVAGPNPREVLIRYCEAASLDTRLEPVELTSSVPPFPGTRLGLFREPGSLDSLLAIRIRRDSRSRRWVAGNGNHPIVAFKAPPLPADAEHVPVTSR